LLETGKVKGYEGHHINDVNNNPNMAGDSRNIDFVKGRQELKNYYSSCIKKRYNKKL
jgi:hypothetical protein